MAGKAFALYDRNLDKLVGSLTFLETPNRVGIAVTVATDLSGTFAGCIDKETAEALNLCGWQGLAVNDPPPPAPTPETPPVSVVTARGYEKEGGPF